MNEFLLPHTRFMGEKSRIAQRRIAENLTQLEAWLREVKSQTDLQTIADRVGEFRKQILDENAKKPESLKKGTLRTLPNGLGLVTGFRIDMAQMLRELAEDLAHEGNAEATFTWSVDEKHYERGSSVAALLAFAGELHA